MSTTIAEARSRYWQEQTEAWQASGKSQLVFCKAHKLSYPRFGYWLRKFRRRAARDEHSQRPGFVPVTTALVPDPSERLSLLLPNGVEVRGIGADNLLLVPQLLDQLS